MAIDYKTHRDLSKQLENLAAHPSGPNIHKDGCPNGYIMDSEGRFGPKGRCISNVEYRRLMQERKTESV